MADDEVSNRLVLAEALRAVVSLHMAEMRDWTSERRLRVGMPVGWSASVHLADSMMFKSKIKGRAERAFNTWARGMAVLAFQPGGVDAFGLHFCAEPHSGCASAVPADLVRRIQRILADPVAMAGFHAILDDFEELTMSKNDPGNT